MKTGKNFLGNIRIDVSPASTVVGDIADPDIYSIEKQEAKRFGDDTKHRAHLVCWMMGVVSIWLIGVLIIVTFNRMWNFMISDNVLMMLLGTTTINVLGLSKIILNGLFGSGRRKRKMKIQN